MSNKTMENYGENGSTIKCVDCYEKQQNEFQTHHTINDLRVGDYVKMKFDTLTKMFVGEVIWIEVLKVYESTEQFEGILCSTPNYPLIEDLKRGDKLIFNFKDVIEINREKEI